MTLTAGIALTLTLPIGCLISVSGAAFQIVFLAHLVLQVGAVLGAMLTIWRLLKSGRFGVVWRILFTAFLLVLAANSMLPVTNRDALIHHLAVPKWWIRDDAIRFYDWHTWSYFPMLLDLAYTGFLNWKLESACALYHMSFLIILAATVGSFLHKESREVESSTAFGVLLVFTLPLAVKLSIAPMVDLGLAAYSAIAIFSLIQWVEEGGSKREQLISAGVGLGLAMAAKYNGLLAALLLAPAVMIYAQRSGIDFKRVAVAGTVVILSALATYSPWVLRNLISTGNPVYPLYNSLFGIISIPHAVGGPKPLQLRIQVYGENIFQLLMIPFRMVLFGADDNPRSFDGVLSPVLMLMFVPFVWWSKERWKPFLCAFMFAYFVFAVFMAGARVRYMAPLLFPAAVLAACGAKQIVGLISKSRGTLLINALIVAQFVIGAGYLSRLSIENETLQYYLNGEGREAYLKRMVPFYRVISHLNSDLPKASVVYLVYTPNYFYYFDIGVRGSFDPGDQILSWAKASGSYEEFEGYFDNLGVTHLLIHIRRLTEYLNQYYDVISPEKREYWNRFVTDRLKLVMDFDAAKLYEVKAK